MTMLLLWSAIPDEQKAHMLSVDVEYNKLILRKLKVQMLSGLITFDISTMLICKKN